jgi:stage II sporulation protein D
MTDLSSLGRLGAAAALLVGVVLAPAGPASPQASPPTIRVGILREQERVVIMSDRPIEVNTPSGRLVLDPAAYEVSASAGGLEIAGAGRVDTPVRLVPTGGARLHVAIRPYRGSLEIRRTSSGRITVINQLDLEEYLYGVLRMEVDPRWPASALHAQAVAARTLALYSLNRFAAEGYDVRATTESQVYGGVSAEDPRTTAAVEATRGQVLVFDGRPIFAAYHSDSGGHTEASELVWGGRYAYLRPVADPYTVAQPWMLRLPVPAFEERLRRAGRAVGGGVAEVDVAELTPSGRVAFVRITSSTGSLVLRGTELRTLLGAEAMKSTLFTARMVPGEAAVEFAGRGSGHGVGMSQWGARGQALLGRAYPDILRYYYTGVTLEAR